jgi:putative transposase
MPRIHRIDVGSYVYHVTNRANARVPIFDNDEDYRLFESILEEDQKKFDMRILAYCLMPNHWHLVLYPKNDGDLSKFMSWVTNTHTRRWHVMKGTVGEGHLYQGRYKSFLCQTDAHFLILVRYVERNAKKANLVKWAEDWKYSSAWRREKGTDKQKKLLSPWPVPAPKDYLSWLNEPQTVAEEEAIECSIAKNIPFGTGRWQDGMIKKHDLEQTMRPVGRPRKDSSKTRMYNDLKNGG